MGKICVDARCSYGQHGQVPDHRWEEDGAPERPRRLRGYAEAIRVYREGGGHDGPVTLRAVQAGITAELGARLTWYEYGLVMTAVDAAYHRGIAAGTAERG